jgi:hypothetical protein
MGARITVRHSRSARIARIAGALSVPVLVLTALGHRFSLVPELALLALVSTGIVLAIVAMASGIYALVEIWREGDEGAGSAILGVIYSVPGVVLFAGTVYALAVYPQLSDISTDVIDPPAYLTLGPLNPERAAPPPEEQRELQLAAYPGITARRYPVRLNRVFEAVHQLIGERGWQIVAETRPVETPGVPAGDEREAVIQAVARTLLFQFTDHVVIRLAPEPGGTRVDVRSASGFGRHDLGQNARRIRALLTDLDLVLQGERSELQPASE